MESRSAVSAVLISASPASLFRWGAASWPSKDIFDRALASLGEEKKNRVRLEWVEHTKQLKALCPYRKLAQARVLLLCILVARATDEAADISAINLAQGTKRTEGRTYTARFMADNVVAPKSLGKLDFGSTSSNPLNGNIFVNASVRQIEDVTGALNSAGWEFFMSLATKLRSISKEDAFHALKGYMEAADLPAPPKASQYEGERLAELTVRIESFVRAHTESGGSAQALVAACADLMHATDTVAMGKVNAPDRHQLSDVTVETKYRGVIAYDVKDKRLGQNHVRSAYESIAMKENTPNLLVFCAFRDTEQGVDGVEHDRMPVAFFRSLPDFVSHAFITSGIDERQFGERLLERFSARLGELNIQGRP